MTPRNTRIAALLFLLVLLAPAGEHLYWALGGTWRLDAESTWGLRIVAAVVVALLVGAALVVLVRAGWLQQAFVPDWVIRSLAWGLAAFFLGHALVSVVEAIAGMDVEWWLYGPGGLMIGLFALAVASSRVLRE